MSMFEDSRYRWRETYFVLFDAKRRPSLASATKAISAINKRFELINLSDDGQGRIDSMSVISHDDFAALDICCAEGEEAIEQAAALVDDLKKLGADVEPPVPWSQLKRFDARFDVLHFEQVPDDLVEDAEEDEMLDPSALLVVLGALAKLTGGVAIDPQAGTFLTDDE